MPYPSTAGSTSTRVCPGSSVDRAPAPLPKRGARGPCQARARATAAAAHTQHAVHEPPRPATRAGQLPAAPSSANLSVRIRARPQRLETQRTGSAPLAASPAAQHAALPDG